MQELLERVVAMLDYIELLDRALTISEQKKVHALLVEIGLEQAKLKRNQEN